MSKRAMTFEEWIAGGMGRGLSQLEVDQMHAAWIAAQEAIKQHDAEPVAYWNGKGSIIPAEDVSYLPNWSDYYPIALYRRPQA